MHGRIMALVVACLWASSPLFACLPNPSMSPAEMECCKKMAGNCDMGGGNHKCCDTTINHAAPAAAIVNSVDIHVPALSIIITADRAGATEAPFLGPIDSQQFLISASPPGFTTVLRI